MPDFTEGATLEWLGTAMLTGIALAAIAVWARRRFGRNGLLLAAVSAGPLACAFAFAMASRSTTPADFGFTKVAAIPGTVLGTIALTIVVDRLAKGSTIPDPVPETAFGAFAFLGGMMAGLIFAVVALAFAHPIG